MSRNVDDAWDVTEGSAGQRVGGAIPKLHVGEKDTRLELLEINPRMGERMQAMKAQIASFTLFFDQPKVLDFKTSTLESHGFSPIGRFVGVAVDVRHDLRRDSLR